MSDTDVAEIHHPSRPVIGVVGLGAMGGQIAGRLLSQGNLVYGTNRTKAKADPLIDRLPGASGSGPTSKPLARAC